MKAQKLDHESEIVPDQLAPHLCQLFEIQYCGVSGEVETVFAVSTTGNGRITEREFDDLPTEEQTKIRARIKALIAARSLENCRSNELGD